MMIAIYGGIFVSLLAIIAFCVYWNLNKEQRLYEEVEVEREKGLVKTWGQRVNSPRTLAHARSSFDNGDSSQDNQDIEVDNLGHP